MTANDRVMLFDSNQERAATIAGSLARLGLSTVQCHRPAEARDALRRERPAVAVVVESEDHFAGLHATARDQGIPVLGVFDPGKDPSALLDRVRDLDGWASLAGAVVEVPARVAGMLAQAEASARRAEAPAIDSRFLALVVHDLRTPLNVIVLAIRAIAQSVPEPNEEFDEDLRFLTENARQIEKMLAQLGDYCRLLEAESQISGTEFETRRFLSDFLEERLLRPGNETPAVRLEVAENSPREVSLDPIRVRLALQHALANVVVAAGESPIRLKSSGDPGRWVVEMVVDKAPPATVSAVELRSHLFERLAGSAAERRGLDLAIAARVSELFGGSARLEVEPGRRSSVVLEWPERL